MCVLLLRQTLLTSGSIAVCSTTSSVEPSPTDGSASLCSLSSLKNSSSSLILRRMRLVGTVTSSIPLGPGTILRYVTLPIPSSTHMIWDLFKRRHRRNATITTTPPIPSPLAYPDVTLRRPLNLLNPPMSIPHFFRKVCRPSSLRFSCYVCQVWKRETRDGINEWGMKGVVGARCRLHVASQ